VERFGIDSGRIAVEGRLLPERPSALDTNGQEENRRVEIIASETILAPVSIGDTARTMESPGIRFDNEIVAERGVAAWQVEMQLAGRPIRRLHGEAVLTETIDDRFTPSELAAIERGDQPISYTLSARDNDGKTTATEPQTIGITIERRGADSILSSSTADAPAAIVLFDYNSAEIRPAARAMLKRLRSRIPAGASLKLVGFADETGEADYNRKLSLARAQAVSEAIGATAADIQGVGESTLLYDNDAPEGRFYSRSVRIEVK
jgi:outer membrane protein OmpA-like peptidoglycan-associated protein